jgi:hypothetical protein
VSGDGGRHQRRKGRRERGRARDHAAANAPDAPERVVATVLSSGSFGPSRWTLIDRVDLRHRDRVDHSSVRKT